MAANAFHRRVPRKSQGPVDEREIVMAKNIKVTRESPSGLNTHFKVPGQGEITRGRLADQVERGQHPDYHVRRVNNQRIIASNPARSTDNNLD